MTPRHDATHALRPRTAAITLAAVFAFAAPLTAAEDITLTSRQGNLTLTGRVSGFDGTYIQIESPHGPLTLSYAGVSCAGAACPDPAAPPVLRMSGEHRLTDLLLPALLEGYARDHGLTAARTVEEAARSRVTLTGPDGGVVLTVAFHTVQAAEGFTDLLTYDADVALTFRGPTAAEMDRAAQAGQGAADAIGDSIVLGADGIVPVVSPFNPVRSIDPAQLIAAFRGALTDWSALDLPAQPLTLHLGPDDAYKVADWLQLSPDAAVLRHATTDDVVAAVADDPGGLGLVPLGTTGIAQAVGLRDGCDLTAWPDKLALKTGDYPLTATAFAHLRTRRQPAIVLDFLNWTRQPAAQMIVRRSGLTDQGVVPIPLDDQGERLAHAITIAGPETSLADLQAMVALLHVRTRQSVTFRFATGAVALDPASAAHLRVLALNIRDGDYDGRELMFIGFSDGEGDAVANRDLSAARAVFVENALLGLLGQTPPAVRFATRGFGEAMPIGCDDTVPGRQLNRRVEVWVGD